MGIVKALYFKWIMWQPCGIRIQWIFPSQTSWKLILHSLFHLLVIAIENENVRVSNLRSHDSVGRKNST